ncbi:hypothetical protein HNR74_003603 [Flammeovirga kamogawensis]|nr:hypothetical protein [Flammeovirga kamogawensis]
MALIVQELINKYLAYLHKKKDLLSHQTNYLNSALTLMNIFGIVATAIYLLKVEVYNFEIPIIQLF